MYTDRGTGGGGWQQNHRRSFFCASIHFSTAAAELSPTKQPSTTHRATAAVRVLSPLVIGGLSAFFGLFRLRELRFKRQRELLRKHTTGDPFFSAKKTAVQRRLHRTELVGVGSGDICGEPGVWGYSSGDTTYRVHCCTACCRVPTPWRCIRDRSQLFLRCHKVKRRAWRWKCGGKIREPEKTAVIRGYRV